MLSNAGVIFFFAVALCLYLDAGLRALVEHEIGIPPALILVVGFICLVAVMYGNRRKA